MIVYWTIPVGLQIKDQMYTRIDIKRHIVCLNLKILQEPMASETVFLMWGKSEVKIGSGLE